MRSAECGVRKTESLPAVASGDRKGDEVVIACLEYPGLGPMVEAPGVRVVSVKGNVFAVRGRGWSPAFRRVVTEEARNADIVHNHGLWMWPNAYAREAAVAAGKPLVISPRGMLEPWSLNRSKLRKAVAWRLFEKKNLRSAAMFHATAESEASSIRHTAEGIRRETGDRRQETGDRGQGEVPIVIAPNGVDLPELANNPVRVLVEKKFPELRDKRWVVFMSRLHPKKGIEILLSAWGAQKKVAGGEWRVAGGETETPPTEALSCRDAVLVIAGPDLVGYRKEIERMVWEMGLQESVVLTGEVRGAEKDALLANADVFVLPSYSENFGIVVAEAMAWGRPVITTTGTPWKEVAEVGAGWWVKPEAAAVEEALQDALNKSGAELDSMGAKGRKLVEERYGWSVPAERLIKAYEEVIATADRRETTRRVERSGQIDEDKWLG